MKTFWIVMSEARGISSWPHRHSSEDSAIAESVRLAREHGGIFVVLEAKVSSSKSDVVVKRLQDDTEIPF